VSALLVFGQAAILAFVAAVALIEGEWWIGLAALPLVAVAVCVGIVNAKRDDWFV
jgi:hypothetical protein